MAEEPADGYKFGLQLFNRESWSAAADQFKTVIDDYPDSPQAAAARFYYGFSLMEQDKFKQAREELRRFAKDNADNKRLPDAQYRIGECSYHLKEYSVAESELKSFLTQHKKSDLTDWVLLFLGDSQLAQKKASDATSNYQTILKDFPNSELAEDARMGLGRAFEQTKQFADALKMYRRVTNEGRVYKARALFRIGVIQLGQNKPDEAATAFEDYLTRYSSNRMAPVAAYNAGLSRYRSREFEKAVVNFQKVPADSRYGALSARNAAVAYTRLGKVDEAITILRKAKEEFSSKTDGETIAFTLADTLRKQKQYKAAMSEFIDVTKKWPKGVFTSRSLHLAAECALLTDDTTKCGELLDEFAEKFPQSSGTLPTRVQILRARMLLTVDGVQNHTRALKLLNESATANSDAATSNLAREWLTRALIQLGRHTEVDAAAAPLVGEIMAGRANEFDFVLILVASSNVEAAANPSTAPDRAKQLYTEAVKLTTRFIEMRSSDAEAANGFGSAYGYRAWAHAGLGNKVKAMDDLKQVQQANPKLHVISATNMARIAYDAEDYPWAVDLFAIPAGLPKVDSAEFDAKNLDARRSQGLMDLAWSLKGIKNYSASATKFETVASEYPQLPIAAESLFMAGRCHQLANSRQQAINVLTRTFTNWATKNPTAEQPANDSPQAFAYKAGKLAANLLAEDARPSTEANDGDSLTAKQKTSLEKANELFSKLVEKYPQAEDLDGVLEDWAFTNLETMNYEEADRIFAKLISLRPNSVRTFRARLVLAESTLMKGELDAAEKKFSSLFNELSNRKNAEDDGTAEVAETALFQLIRIGQDKEDWIKVEERCKTFKTKFAQSGFLNETKMRLGEAQFNLKDFESANNVLNPLKQELLQLPIDDANQEWSGRVWVILAEIQLEEKNYPLAKKLLVELKNRDPESPFVHQAYELLGRAFIRQAPPDFTKARDAFGRAVSDKNGKGTRTAAKAQFMIGETWLMEKNYEKALLAYLKVVLQFKFPEWQAPALYQAAQCEESMMRLEKARKLYLELIEKYPNSRFVPTAQLRLKSLAGREAEAG